MPSDTYKGYTISFSTQNETWSVSSLDVHNKTYKQCVAAIDRHTKKMRAGVSVTALSLGIQRNIPDDLDDLKVQIVEYLGRDKHANDPRDDKIAIMSRSWRSEKPTRSESQCATLLQDTEENRIRLELARSVQADIEKLKEQKSEIISECTRVTLRDIAELVKIAKEEPEELTR